MIVYPSQQESQRLIQDLQKNMQESFIYLLEVASQGLQKNLQHLHKKIQNLDTQSSFSPMFYILHDQLYAALQRQEPESVKQQIQNLDAQESLTTNHLSVLQNLASVTCLQARELFLQDSEGFQLTINPIDSVQFDQISSHIHDALDNIKQVCPDSYWEFINLVNEIWLCHSKDFKGVSSFRFLTGMFLAIPNDFTDLTDYLTEWLVHEAAHMNLHIRLAKDPFVTNDLSERYSSPLRKDPRPVIQIYHAMFVLSRVIFIFYKLKRQDKVESFFLQFNDAVKVLEQRAQFTLSGQDFFDRTKALIKSCH